MQVDHEIIPELRVIAHALVPHPVAVAVFELLPFLFSTGDALDGLEFLKPAVMARDQDALPGLVVCPDSTTHGEELVAILAAGVG